METPDPKRPLRRGWTTGACAAAASRAAYQALLTVPLPGGQRPSFALAISELGRDFARAGIVKDAGDDPDVTHGALVVATVWLAPGGTGIAFRAGEGVGTVTLPGLPLPPGEPAINPMPREMIRAAMAEVAAEFGGGGDAVVEISIPGGEKIAERTLNGRLGIVGGLSILGTTGIVVPYSCAAWIHSIYRGIDVARAAGLPHLAGATGSTSEAAVARLYGLTDAALIDMGDFVGGMLKYLRRHPVARVTVAGGLAKMTKLGQGLLDLHSRRGEVDLDWLAARAGDAALAERIGASNSAMEAFDHARTAGIDLAAPVIDSAWQTAAKVLEGADTELEIVMFDRAGELLGRSGFRNVHRSLP
jgi:cobalt-precorrin-5B (C1)-methyltransferase